jgi:hypothetical protein
MFAIAGFLGALLVNSASLLLLSPVRGWRTLAKAAAWACAGAFLGFLAAELSDSVGAGIALVVGDPPSASMGTNDYYLNFYCAFVIWQTGMALLFPVMLPHAEAVPPRQSQPSAAAPSAAKLGILGKLFFVCVFAVLGILGYSVARSRYRTWNLQRQSDKLARETPPVANLPVIAPRPLEQMLILHEVSGYAETSATMHILPAQRADTGVKPEQRTVAGSIVYRVEYEKAGSTGGPADNFKASATVSEFPNDEWAKYQLQNGPVYGGQNLYRASTRTTKFGQTVLMISEPDLCVFWPSSNKLVVVNYPGQQAEEILRQYLARYPSSL